MRLSVLAAVVSVSPTLVSQCAGSSSSDTTAPEEVSTETSTETAADSSSSEDSSVDCPTYESSTADSAPIQTAGAGAPVGASSVSWSTPASWTSWVAFEGTVGSAAVHEGIDYIHDDSDVAEVGVTAAADGEVVYVRTGCPESDLFSSNTSVRECGSGWGNHVVLHHGGTTYTRYGHLSEGQVFVEVGDTVSLGDVLGVMGNTGRSETRHLHFELGSITSEIDPCGGSWSFTRVYDPAEVGL